ncbi:MAG TPA: hypothetical protein VEP90_22805 [Methylomirabilota bacterium]|nr:hypothetical protein [Methylomirabilota bacterium]
MRKHLLPLFFLILGLLIIIPHNVYAPSSIQFKSFCDAFASTVNTINCTITGVTTGDTIAVNVYGIGIFNNFAVSDGQGNSYLEKVSSITGSGSGVSTYIFTTLSTLGSGSLLVVVATGGPNRVYEMIALDYSGVARIGTSGTEQNDNSGNSGTSTVSLTGTSSSSIMIDDFAQGGSAITLTQNNGQTIRDSATNGGFTPCQNGCKASDSSSPILGWSWSGGSCSPCTISHSSLELQGNLNTNPTVSQCYGNCGTPAVTAVNTNSTHTINFNVSQTYIYISQIQLTGFIVNMTMNIACNPTPFGPCKNNQPFLGVYTTNTNCVGSSAFTTGCPGNLISSSSSSTYIKGKFTQPLNIPVFVGQWLGVAFSASQSGFDINDTNTNVPVVNTQGIMPLTVSTVTSQGNSKANVYAWIVGQSPVTGGPPTGPTGPCGLLDCVLLGLIRSGCGIETASCLVGAGFFWMILLSGVVIGMVLWGEKKVGFSVIPGEFFVFVPISFTFLFFEIGIFPFWVPIFMFIVLLLLFASMITGKIGGKGGLQV